MITSPGSVAFNVFGLDIYWYGVFIGLAFITGTLVAAKLAEWFYKSKEHFFNVLDLSPVLLIGALLGARGYYVLFNLDYYKYSIWEMFSLREGGLSIHGAVLGGIIFGWIFTKIKSLSFLRYADFMVAGLSLGQSIGRWGNFFNNEAFGRPSTFKFLYIPEHFRPAMYSDYEYFHPTFLYESIWDFCIFGLLIFLFLKYRTKAGIIFFLYLCLYSFGRFFIESLRVDNIFSIYGMPLAQFVSLIFFLVGIIGISFVRRSKKAK